MAFISAQPVMNGIFPSPEESAVVQCTLRIIITQRQQQHSGSVPAEYRKCWCWWNDQNLSQQFG